VRRVWRWWLSWQRKRLRSTDNWRGSIVLHPVPRKRWWKRKQHIPSIIGRLLIYWLVNMGSVSMLLGYTLRIELFIKDSSSGIK
jgi:hypothetical protein